jgi:hypothetical protein
MTEVKHEVRTTVDEKIINKMAEPVKTQEPIIKEEVKHDVQEQNTDTNESSDSLYDLPSDDSENKDNNPTEKDEFGNDVTKQKVYTEEEVNELMRQRFNRTKKEESVKQTKQQTNNESESEENWEQQLEGFVENTVEKLNVKKQQKLREAEEQSMMSEFEGKIVSSMGRYKDFKDVVGKVPISDPMLLATRQMKDPGAFIYAAAKTQAKELERIAKIQDPFYQAAEMGRLEERMRKVRSGTGSPKPVSQIKGDIQNKSYIRPSVDDLVRKDALKKLSNRRV